MSFVEELKRRNVFKVGTAYVVAAWLIIQFSDILLDNMDAPSWVLNAIMLVLAIGFLITLFVAWAFEVTPEGIKREADVDRSNSVTANTGKRLNNAIVVLLALAVVYLLFDKFSGQQPNAIPVADSVEANVQIEEPLIAEAESSPQRQSIAVLPFDNRSNREEDQFFTDGIHDDLLTTIARIGSMKVISRTSVMEYKGTTKKIPEIAKELGVANVLEGGIQRSGNQVRINVQLIDAQTDEHLWAEIFDRELNADNLFAIQSEISTKIAGALQAALSPEEIERINTRPTDNLVALEAWSRGRQLMATRTAENLELAAAEYERAVELDPNFALAWVGIADTAGLLSGYGTLTLSEAHEIAKPALDRAFAINDQLGEAHASLANLLGFQDRWEEAEPNFKRAIELSPNYAPTYHWYSLALSQNPLRIDETLQLAEKAVELDPRSSIIQNWLGSAYWNRGLYSLAETQYRKLIDLAPDFAQGYRSLLSLKTYQQSQYAQAHELALVAYRLDPSNPNSALSLLSLYLELSDMNAAREMQERLYDLDSRHASSMGAEMDINLYQGNHSGAIEVVHALSRLNDTTWISGSSLAFNAFLAGDAKLAKQLFLEAEPGWMVPEGWPTLISEQTFFACSVSWLLVNSEDEELGRQLLSQTVQFLEDQLPQVHEHPDSNNPEICYLVAGDTDKALLSIESQLAHRHLYGWNVLHRLPMYDQIRHEARYQAAFNERQRIIDGFNAEIAQTQQGLGL